MALRVQVVLQPQIVLDIINLRRLPQIAVLETGVEDKYILLLRDEDLELWIAVVSLSVEPRQVLEQVPVEV